MQLKYRLNRFLFNCLEVTISIFFFFYCVYAREAITLERRPLQMGPHASKNKMAESVQTIPSITARRILWAPP
jgi:hypothetical protein